MKQQCIKYTIVVRGREEGDLDDAFMEAARLISDGYRFGTNRNDSGGFYFESTDDVPKGKWPA